MILFDTGQIETAHIFTQMTVPPQQPRMVDHGQSDRLDRPPGLLVIGQTMLGDIKQLVRLHRPLDG